MPAFFSEVGMPYWMDLMTSDPAASFEFYTRVFGWEVTNETDDYAIARLLGLPVAGFIPQPADTTMPDTWVTYFRAGNVGKDCQRVIELGGNVVSVPQEVERGFMALCTDPAGALFGLIQPFAEEPFFAAGEPGLPVWHELTATSNFRAALDFYGELFNWEIRTQGSLAEGFEYGTAEEEGAPFAGFWNAEGTFPPQVPCFWQTYLGVRDMTTAVTTVTSSGGDIIREPWDSPFGRMSVLADSTGATITVTEVADAPEEDISESDDILNL
ncbi:MAG: VOC family protein [Corynebacterium sp.]|nr:VOC family protein [Corynebacterium sp.]